MTPSLVAFIYRDVLSIKKIILAAALPHPLLTPSFHPVRTHDLNSVVACLLALNCTMQVSCPTRSPASQPHHTIATRDYYKLELKNNNKKFTKIPPIYYTTTHFKRMYWPRHHICTYVTFHYALSIKVNKFDNCNIRLYVFYKLNNYTSRIF